MEKRICSVEGCDIKVSAHGFCNRHYLQMHFNGRILDKIARPKNEIEIIEDYAIIYFYDKIGRVKGEGKIDIEDIDRVQALKWYVASTGYAKNDKIKKGMHNFVLGSLYVDHVNGCRLDNRKCNLRIATLKENNRNAKAYSSSGYKGVVTYGSRFAAYIYCDGVKRKIGVFDSPKEAGAAYNVYAKKLFGEFAWVNDV